MTEIEQKALALVNEVCRERGEKTLTSFHTLTNHRFIEALCRALEQHEAFRQEVSDAVEAYFDEDYRRKQGRLVDALARFIITKPDPLVEVFDECFRQEFRAGETWSEAMARKFRAASEKRGGKIVWGEG